MFFGLQGGLGRPLGTLVAPGAAPWILEGTIGHCSAPFCDLWGVFLASLGTPVADVGFLWVSFGPSLADFGELWGSFWTLCEDILDI